MKNLKLRARLIMRDLKQKKQQPLPPSNLVPIMEPLSPDEAIRIL